MKIVHVITTIERGGAENAVLTLAIAQAQSGHLVKLIPLKGLPELFQTATENRIQVSLQALNKNPIIQLSILKKIVSESDIVHAHLPRAEVLVRITRGKGKALYTRHNSERFFPKVPLRISSLLSRWVTRDSDVIAISHAVLDFLKENQELHSTSRPRVIHYGYKIKNSGQTSQCDSLLSEEIRIGTISRLTEQKNLPLLMKFVKNQIIKGRKVCASIVGDGPLIQELKELAFDLGISDSVKFLGRTDNVFVFLETLDFFFLTSNYEGFGLVLLEASDVGIPVITSNTSSVPEVLGHNHPGLFTCGSIDSLMEVFERFITLKDARQRAVFLQRTRLKYFGVDTYFESHNQIYTSHLKIIKLKDCKQ